MTPFASYCIATYKRPTHLLATLKSILAQTSADFEVIVSDNDPQASARAVVDSLADARITYSCNTTNVGMVRNFNTALALAKGSYVVMITDDDPIYPHHLITLREAADQHPNFGACFAAGDIFHEDEFVAQCSNSRLGLTPHRLNGSTQCYNGESFLRLFFENRVPFYMLWSCGIVRRDIAQAVQMPDYGSPFLTDFAYIGLVAARAGVVLIHTSLGRQIVHAGNFGRRQIDELPTAIEGFLSLFPKSQHDTATLNALSRFLTRWSAAHIWFLRRFYRNDPEMRRKVDDCITTLTQTTPLGTLRRELLAIELKQSLLHALRVALPARRDGASPHG